MRQRRTSGKRRSHLVAQIAGLLVLAVAMAALTYLAWQRQQSTAGVARTAAVTSDPAVVEDVERPTAVFLGDSYTQGTGASVEASRWTSLVAADRDWDEVNLGRGGTGYVTTATLEGCGLAFCPTVQAMVTEAVAAQPDVVVVAGGQNDVPAYGDDPEAVDTAITATFEEVRRQLPAAQIIAIGPSTVDRSGPRVTALDAAVRAAATAVDAQYVSLLDPVVLESSMVLADGAHANDEGHRAIADRVLASLS